MKILLSLAFLLFLIPGLAAEERLRVLILSGQNNHDWQKTTPRLRQILEHSGRFVVEVTNQPQDLTPTAVSGFDVLLSDWNTFGSPSVTNWSRIARLALLDFVRRGGGFALVHAGGSSFYDWPEYQQIAGAWWQMDQTSHGPPHEFLVEPTPGHPITRGVRPFKTKDELWVKPGVHPEANVIARAEGQPIAITTSLGKGRGFALLLGHSHTFMDTRGFQQLLVNGVAWSAGKTVP